MARSYTFESNPDSRVKLVCQEAPGHEKTDSHVVLDISGYKLVSDMESGCGLEVVQIYLTVPQMAEVVKMYFWHVAENNIYSQLLRRLLRQRWKIMTNAVAKDLKWMPRYDQGMPL